MSVLTNAVADGIKLHHTRSLSDVWRFSWLLLCFCISLAILGCSPEPRQATSGTNAIAFGDSLVQGKGAARDKNWVSLLSQRYDVTILNKGRNGDTTSAALARLERDVLSNDPRVVLILLGGNDSFHRVSKDITFKNLSEIIDRIQQVGAAVVLIGVRGGLLLDPYDSAFKSLALAKRVYFIPDILEGILDDPALLADLVHPNNQGHQRMADRIAPVFEEAIEGL